MERTKMKSLREKITNINAIVNDLEKNRCSDSNLSYDHIQRIITDCLYPIQGIISQSIRETCVIWRKNAIFTPHKNF